MGRRNRSHFQKSGYVPEKDYRLKQDFLALGVKWPFECESDQINAVQGSTNESQCHGSQRQPQLAS